VKPVKIQFNYQTSRNYRPIYTILPANEISCKQTEKNKVEWNKKSAGNQCLVNKVVQMAVHAT